MEGQQKVPNWFWVIAIFFLLWNIVGVFSFLQHTFISEEVMAALPEDQRNLYAQYPAWTTVVFAIATGAGLLGAIGLVMRKKWSRTMFVISMLAILPQMYHNVFLTDAIAVFGMLQAILMPILVVVFGFFLIWFAGYGIKKHWLK